MPGPTTTTQDIELIIEEKPKDGGGGTLPPADDPGGGDDGSRPSPRKPSPARYYTAIGIGIVSILMFFMALASAFIVVRGRSDWQAVHVPFLLWVNTAVLIASSVTLEMARRRLGSGDLEGYRKLWLITTVLGLLFLFGQVAAWRLLVQQGIYLATNPASSFFYVFTGAHALHLLGGVGALVFVARRNFARAKITRNVASEVTAYYWHFMDALWLFLLALLYFGK